MADLSRIQPHMEIVGADGVHLGTVDSIEGDRIKLTRQDSGSHKHHHHYVSGGLVAADAGQKQSELVAAGAGDQRALARRGGEPAADFLEDGVAGGVAERVVDRLEPVEVDGAEREPARFADRRGAAAERTEKGAAVGEAGQMVGIGDQLRLRLFGLGEPFRAAGALALAALYVTVQQYRHRYAPDFFWLTHFDRVQEIAWLAVILLACDALVEVVRTRARAREVVADDPRALRLGGDVDVD